MHGHNIITDSPFLVPLVALVLVAGLLAAVVLLMRRRKTPQRTFLSTVDETFLPPTTLDYRMPSEHTYVVSRDWKPSSGVYSPLSIPLSPPPQKTLASRVGSMIHVLPPKSNQTFV